MKIIINMKPLETYSNINRIVNVPDGYKVFQYGEDIQVLNGVRSCANPGCPAVMLLRDAADTIFDEQWQYFLYAINLGMAKNNVSHLMGYRLWGMNKTGVYNPETPRRDYIVGENLDSKYDPYLDKLRTFARNCHAVRDFGGGYFQVFTQDGNSPPIMKPGKERPRSIADIDSGKVKATDYFYNPQERLYAFLICNNISTISGNNTVVTPFPHGKQYDWTPDPREVYSFFPLVSKTRYVMSLQKNWNRVTTDYYPSPYRRLYRTI